MTDERRTARTGQPHAEKAKTQAEEAKALEAHTHEHAGHPHAEPKAPKAAGKAGAKTTGAKGGKAGKAGAAKGKGKTTPAKAKAAKAAKSKPATPAEGESEAKPEEVEVVDAAHVARAKPELSEEARAALRLRAAKKAKQPRFRRHEWWRYKDLGGKDAPWRNPQGIHSKVRRHFKYRPPVVSIGYRGPILARGLHPSGFAEVLVHRPEDLGPVDPKTQAVRIGGTVGGRKAEAIQRKADELGIRVLNRRS